MQPRKGILSGIKALYIVMSSWNIHVFLCVFFFTLWGQIKRTVVLLVISWDGLYLWVWYRRDTSLANINAGGRWYIWIPSTPNHTPSPPPWSSISPWSSALSPSPAPEPDDRPLLWCSSQLMCVIWDQRASTLCSLDCGYLQTRWSTLLRHPQHCFHNPLC